jgi:hypothetical protein
MGGKSSKIKIIPKYFKNFNIENRVSNQIEKIQRGEISPSPRHPSTAKLYKEMEGI